MSSSYDTRIKNVIKNPDLQRLIRDIFDTVAGHDHDGANSKALDANNIRTKKMQLNGAVSSPMNFTDNTAASVTSANAQNFNFTAVGSGGTLIFTPDAEAAETFTFTFAAGASISGASPSTNITAETDTKLNVSVDGSAAQEITLVLAGLNSGALIAAAIEAAIQALGGVFAAVTCDYNVTVAGKYTIASGTQGTGSSVVITAPTAGSLTEELKLGIAAGGNETTGTGPCVNSAAVTAQEIATLINLTAVNLTASAVSGNVVITSDTTGKSSKITVGNGTLNAVVGFTNTNAYYGAQDLGFTSGMSGTDYIVIATLNGATSLTGKILSINSRTVSGFTILAGATSSDYVDIVIVGAAA